MFPTLSGRWKRFWLPSTRTRIESLSTTGTSIAAALANSTQVKPPAAAAPPTAAHPIKKSRRLNGSLMKPSVRSSLDSQTQDLSEDTSHIGDMSEPLFEQGRQVAG